MIARNIRGGSIKVCELKDRERWREASLFRYPALFRICQTAFFSFLLIFLLKFKSCCMRTVHKRFCLSDSALAALVRSYEKENSGF